MLEWCSAGRSLGPVRLIPVVIFGMAVSAWLNIAARHQSYVLKSIVAAGKACFLAVLYHDDSCIELKAVAFFSPFLWAPLMTICTLIVRLHAQTSTLGPVRVDRPNTFSPNTFRVPGELLRQPTPSPATDPVSNELTDCDASSSVALTLRYAMC